MTCAHCEHCKAAARNAQDRANLHPLGTHLIHATHGHVVYWRNDIDSRGERGGGHYVYRDGDTNRELIYIWGDEFEIATVDVDIPGALLRFFQTDEESMKVIGALGPGRTYRGGLRLTITYEQTWELSRMAYWARDMGDCSTAAHRGAVRLCEKLRKLDR